jgi:POT family proton-dependent oligopeptide transporter
MFKGHPRALPILFLTELWERFGFYILMAVLVLHMDSAFHWDDAHKGRLYGMFLAAVYFIPILGGWLGDRVLGHLNTIRLGAVSLCLGYVGLTMSSVNALGWFYTGLALIAFGTGIFKANMSVTVGRLYDDRPELKDAGFNLYYMSVNLGAAIAPLAATLLFSLFGTHHYSFAAAAAGLVLAIVTFEMGRGRLAAAVQRAEAARVEQQAAAHPASVAEERPGSGDEAARVVTLVILFAIVIFFWTAFYQNGFAQTLFAERSTRVYAWLRPETYQFFEPAFILVLTPVLLAVFDRMRARGREMSNPVKICFGMLVTAFSMLIMAGASAAGGNADQNVMSPMWLISSYFVITIGEILVSPMGQSFVSKVAPRRLQGIMMGLWFGATAMGSYGSGMLGRSYSNFPHHQYFLILAGLLFGAALLVFLFLPRLTRFTKEQPVATV